MKTKVALKAQAKAINAELKKSYPDTTPPLNFSNPFELLVATILSAQCTDVRVNEVTQVLFKQLRQVQDYVQCPQARLEKLIHSVGFFRQKAKSLKKTAEIILSQYQGQVPCSMEDLVKLSGVGRKTANVILGQAFGVPGLPVDTHVLRIANRLGLTTQSSPQKVEADLCEIVPKREWSNFSLRIILHGRAVCFARKPACERCVIKHFCAAR
ncbi:MAG: endonuclease III [Deltaproteobacteria bacterium]|jgi:endonuclease-3|nr:endonuclease III [Deltaproteobacteria bacterium]